jgi:hypothetical protein
MLYRSERPWKEDDVIQFFFKLKDEQRQRDFKSVEASKISLMLAILMDSQWY